jgi:hypothetical protein
MTRLVLSSISCLCLAFLAGVGLAAYTARRPGDEFVVVSRLR